MVFSSIPAYLDPANWQQAQPNQQVGASTIGASSSSLLLPTPPPLPPPPPQPHGAGGAGSIRPGSMADRARLANIPMPEMALKCPRCESTNTKFCYFNNYSLSQPRHFCKTCRRYWTRGGALRNVPVGGGCRRNKRSKGSGGGSSSSKSSPANSVDMPTSSGNSSSAITSNTAADILGLGPGIPPLRFMAPLHHLADHFPSTESIGMNYGSISGQIGDGSAGDLGFPIGSGLATGGVSAGSSLLSMSGLEQWRLAQQAPQFPFLGGLDSSSGMLPFEVASGVEMAVLGGGPGQASRSKMLAGTGAPTQLPSVKMEENQELNLSRQFLGIGNIPAGGNDPHYWNSGGAPGAPWTDLSGFSSSSTSNAL